MSEVENVVETPEISEAEARAEWFKELKERFGPSAPDEERIEAWKKQAGRIRVVAFSPDEVYMFRPLRASEYKGMIQQVMNIKDVQQQNEALKDKMVSTAILWPKIDPTEMGALFAGTKDSLHMMIMQASNFVTPEQAEVMVREL